ncbi:hypothetical protein LTR53_003944 [Teratosphaeriaceae sp. CCFEE 6253]|nr:hypothetical protein LTR53_012500 [Teratosphaeriaceae sp. CCFEE 6253]KAK3073997.1 hypothetical protein LTR53_003944 [Teratosphaeriaceae sp. CCFEE 6253]
MSAAPNQNRNPQLKSTSVTSPNAYSASPSQLTLSSDASTTFHNPYQAQYTYAPSPQHTIPTGFGYPQQTQYAPHPLQTQHQALSQQQAQAQQPISPSHSRKRRASELGGEPSLSGSSSSTFTNQQPGLVTSAFAAHELGDAGQGSSLAQLPSPVVAKKGRTNTPWTPAEEQRLKTMRDAGSSWSEIAKTFPQRTEGSVKKHWYKDMHYAEFAEDEVSNFVRLTAMPRASSNTLTFRQSAALLQAIKDYENNKWKVIGLKVGKPAKACEQFAKEQGWKM